MSESTITCPNCDHQFELSNVLRSEIRTQLESEVKKQQTQREVELTKRDKILKEKQALLEKNQSEVDDLVANQLKQKAKELESLAAKKIEAQYSDQLSELKENLKAKEGSLQKQLEKEGALQKQAADLAKERLAMEEEVAKKLAAQLSEVEAKAAKKIEERFEGQLKDMREAAAEKEANLKALREQELELRKQQRELAKAKEESELEMQRKLDTEREAFGKQLTEKLNEEHRLKDLEKEQMIRSLRSSVEEMKRKAEQGSMESQGEALENDLEEQLQQSFPHDEITPVAKGVRGADIAQQVRTPMGIECGIILWEAKNTKAWNDAWIAKFKDDMQEKRAVLGILVSVALPSGVARFGRVDGIWVSDPASALSLALALREQLLVLNREQLASVGKNEKMEILYQYLAGTQFQQKISGIVEAFEAMQLQILREKRAMEKQWKEREKQIERVVKNTVGLYGDMQGIIGGQIPAIPALELDSEEGQKDQKKDPFLLE